MAVASLMALRRRPRLLICAVLAIAVYLIAPASFRPATRALIAWNFGTWGFLALVVTMIVRGKKEGVRGHARQEDENPWILLIVGVVAAVAAMAAIVWELGPVKDLTGVAKGLHIGLVAATILSAWTFIHVLFALHYAGEYYSDADWAGPGSEVRAGLKFPGDGDPVWGDFFYQAFVIGCACATADVNTTSSSMRSVCLVQGIVAFFFNTIILALTINIGAGLF
jgi:uncharacterized membrane protein